MVRGKICSIINRLKNMAFSKDYIIINLNFNNKFLNYFLLVLVICIGTNLPAESNNNFNLSSSSDKLFIDAPEEELAGLAEAILDPTVVRERHVFIDHNVLPTPLSQEGYTFWFNLFPDVQIGAVLRKLILRDSGSYTWHGQLYLDEEGSFILTVEKDVVIVNIRILRLWDLSNSI